MPPVPRRAADFPALALQFILAAAGIRGAARMKMNSRRPLPYSLLFACISVFASGSILYGQQPLPGTAPLTESGDLAAKMVDGMHAYLDRASAPYSYLFTREYGMSEFNFANVVNYAELASLMAPRPFMVERGHNDGVAPDEWVAYEFAEVRRFHDSKMKMPRKARIDGVV